MPKLVRALTLMSGSISQFGILFLLNREFGDSGIILLGVVVILASVGNQFEFGKFSLVVSAVNNHTFSYQKKRVIIGSLFTQVIRNNLIFVIIASPTLSFLISTLSFVNCAIFVFFIAVINVSTFIAKYLLATGLQSRFFGLYSILHLIVPFVVFILTGLDLALVPVLQITYGIIAAVNVCIALTICHKHSFKPGFKGKSDHTGNAYSNTFFLIGLELGLLYQWDRIWVSEFMTNAEAASYGLILLIFSSLASILSIDYQNFWNDSFSTEKMHFSKQFWRMQKQGLLVALLFICGVFVAFTFLNKNVDLLSPAVLLLCVSLYFQSMHNLTAGITSKSISGLKFHAYLLSACICIRIAFLFPDMQNLSMSLDKIVISWTIPFVLIQFPATLYYATRLQKNA